MAIAMIPQTMKIVIMMVETVADLILTLLTAAIVNVVMLEDVMPQILLIQVQ